MMCKNAAQMQYQKGERYVGKRHKGTEWQMLRVPGAATLEDVF